MNRKEMQIAWDKKVEECLELLEKIVKHLGIEEQSSDSEGAE
jgi:hypothetical protein